MKTIAVLGTLDTKGTELAFLRSRIESRGLRALLIDCGVAADPTIKPDISAAEIAALGGVALEELRREGDRGKAVTVMGLGAKVMVNKLYVDGLIHGAVAAGGSGNTWIAASAMSELPIGFPKLIVSTLASGDVSRYVGIRDVTMMYSVGDIEGVNQLTAVVLNNAAGAIAGMVQIDKPEVVVQPTIGMTMFGVTTPAVKAIRAQLEERGFQVLVFHATGTGGRAMEALVSDGIIQGLVDLTTTELADEVGGGILSAGPDRLKAGIRASVPQVIAPGAIDMVNFGARDTVPARFENRRLYIHNPQVTLMRTSVEENKAIAELMARNLEGADPRLVSVMIPLKGFSMIDKDGAPFWDPDADQAFITTLRSRLPIALRPVELDMHINDQAFADRVVEAFMEKWANKEGEQ